MSHHLRFKVRGDKVYLRLRQLETPLFGGKGEGHYLIDIPTRTASGQEGQFLRDVCGTITKRKKQGQRGGKKRDVTTSGVTPEPSTCLFT